MSEAQAPSIEELIACARREVGFRKRVYPRLVARGRMTAANAKREIELMEAIRLNLENQSEPITWTTK